MANDPIADAKKFLAESNKKFQPLTPDKPAPAAAAPAKPAVPAMPAVGLGRELAEKAKMVNNAKKALDDSVPKMHDGGKVKKDGLHNLEKGEVVIPKDKIMKKASGLMDGLAEAAEEKAEPKDGKKEEKPEKKSGKKHESKPKWKSTHVDHHDNGSHTVHHTGHPTEDGSPADEMSYAVPDMDGLNQGMNQNVGGEPAPGEAAEAAPAAPAAPTAPAAAGPAAA